MEQLSNLGEIRREIIKQRVTTSRDFELMSRGVKPAYLVTSIKEIDRIAQDFYPHVYTTDGDYQQLIIFREEKDKEGYCESVKDDDEEKVLGKYLGYPPVAVEFFIKFKQEWAKGNRSLKRARIDYHGVMFICAEDTVNECLQWLRDKRPVPVDLQTGIHVNNIK